VGRPEMAGLVAAGEKRGRGQLAERAGRQNGGAASEELPAGDFVRHI
jgi:hypothetical protein